MPYKDKIRKVFTDLIKNYGVGVFYSGCRGNFDYLCAEVIFELKKSFPHIKNIMVLSYLNLKDFILPKYFDESVYLLEGRVPPRYAILRTNQKMVLLSDFVVSGVLSHYGGAYKACDFAKRHKKIILDIFGDNK